VDGGGGGRVDRPAGGGPKAPRAPGAPRGAGSTCKVRNTAVQLTALWETTSLPTASRTANRLS